MIDLLAAAIRITQSDPDAVTAMGTRLIEAADRVTSDGQAARSAVPDDQAWCGQSKQACVAGSERELTATKELSVGVRRGGDAVRTYAQALAQARREAVMALNLWSRAAQAGQAAQAYAALNYQSLSASAAGRSQAEEQAANEAAGAAVARVDEAAGALRTELAGAGEQLDRAGSAGSWLGWIADRLRGMGLGLFGFVGENVEAKGGPVGVWAFVGGYAELGVKDLGTPHWGPEANGGGLAGGGVVVGPVELGGLYEYGTDTNGEARLNLYAGAQLGRVEGGMLIGNDPGKSCSYTFFTGRKIADAEKQLGPITLEASTWAGYGATVTLNSTATAAWECLPFWPVPVPTVSRPGP
jgi:hypothetical protein